MLSLCRVGKCKLKGLLTLIRNACQCLIAPFLFANDGIDNGSLSYCEGKLSIPIVSADRSLRQT